MLGPYKGGIRFAPGVNEDVLKFLAFEQCFKNSLTNLPIGGAKGGADFDPKNKSDNEIRRFCWAYIEELRKYIGPDIDIPAGDIGVGIREIGYMYGHYLKLENKFTGILTSKDINFGGSHGREQATGHGCIYFLEAMLSEHNYELKNKKIAISGAGNVALYAAEKCIQKEAIVISLSDRGGCVYFKQGLSLEQLDDIKLLKLEQHGSLETWAVDKPHLEFYQNKKPWGLECDIAVPCAVENEISKMDIQQLISNHVIAICEGANMPLTAQAQLLVHQANLLYAPSKAANAGGVVVSVLEQSQNAQYTNWSLKKIDKSLYQIMRDIHGRCIENIPKVNGIYNYKKGAHLCSFKKLAETLVAFGIK